MLPDPFANAKLTPEQQEALTRLQTDLGEAQTRLKNLESKIATLEKQVAEEHYLLTRPEFNREVARMLAFDERYGGTSSVLYFDIANLSTVGTLHGHNIASEAVKIITHVMMRNMRRSDIVGRIGVDEFGILLVRCDNHHAWKKGHELAALLATSLDSVGGQKLKLDVSFGAYTFREEEDVATGLKQAAEALTKTDKR